jgi:hypothetical protein
LVAPVATNTAVVIATTEGGAPPSLTTIQATNTDALDYLRQRREAIAAEQTTPSAETTAGGTSEPSTTSSANAPAAEATTPGTSPKTQKKPRVVAATRAYENSSVSAENAQNIDLFDTLYQQSSSPNGYGTWFQGFGDYERHENIAPGTTSNTTRTQWIGGGFSALDKTFDLSSYGTPSFLTIGLLGGGIDIQNKFDDTSTFKDARQTEAGGSVGVYATYSYGNFAIDSLFKTDILNYRQSQVAIESQKNGTKSVEDCSQGLAVNSMSGFVPGTTKITPTGTTTTYTPTSGSTSETNYSLVSNLYYRIPLDGHWSLEPTFGTLYEFTDYGSGAAALGIKDGSDFRIQGGARIRTSWQVDRDHAINLAVLAACYSDVSVNGYIIATTDLPSSVAQVDQGKVRALGAIEAEVANLNNGQSLQFRTEVRGGEDLIGVAGNLGYRYAW